MRCEVCSRGMNDGVALFRQNPKGETGVWRCWQHNVKPVDPDVRDIIDAVLGAPQQAEPVALTDEQIDECWDWSTDHEPDPDGKLKRRSFARALLAASAPALQARRFSCHLERDFGKAPCDRDCGKLRCMYPSEQPDSAQPVADRSAEAQALTLRSLLEDWLTSFADTIEGGEADELVAATRAALAAAPLPVAPKAEPADEARDWARVQLFAKKIMALMDTKECALSSVSGLAHDASERADWIERIARKYLATPHADSAQPDTDPSAPWLTKAHLLCTDHGIPQGRIDDRLDGLRERLTQPVADRSAEAVWTEGYTAGVNDSRAFSAAHREAERNDQMQYKLPPTTPNPYAAMAQQAEQGRKS